MAPKVNLNVINGSNVFNDPNVIPKLFLRSVLALLLHCQKGKNTGDSVLF